MHRGLSQQVHLDKAMVRHVVLAAVPCLLHLWQVHDEDCEEPNAVRLMSTGRTGTRLDKA